MAFFTRSGHDDGTMFEAEMEALRRELARLSRRVARLGGRAANGTRGQFADLPALAADAVAELVPAARREARRAGSAVRENPAAAAALAGLVVAGLLATIAFSRR